MAGESQVDENSCPLCVQVPWGLLGLDSTMAVSWQCWPLVVLGVVALHASTCLGTYEHTCTLSTRSRGVHPQGICGKNLPKILSDICGPGGYMGRWFSKREAPTDASELSPLDVVGAGQSKMPWADHIAVKFNKSPLSLKRSEKRSNGITSVVLLKYYLGAKYF